MVYQEQVMEICRVLSGYSYGRADIVRRAMAKKKQDVMERERQAFVYGSDGSDGSSPCCGAVANGVSAETANAIFDEIAVFADYVLNPCSRLNCWHRCNCIARILIQHPDQFTGLLFH